MVDHTTSHDCLFLSGSISNEHMTFQFLPLERYVCVWGGVGGVGGHKRVIFSHPLDLGFAMCFGQ